MSNAKYVRQLNPAVVKSIELALRRTIADTGHYTKDEMEELVQCGLDSKISDVSHIADIYKILNIKGEV